MAPIVDIADPGSTLGRREIALFIALGVAIRVAWMILVHAFTDPVDLGEASNAALAFARTGVVADAYFVGQGPTAHLMPTMIVIAGTIERLFGEKTAAANLALAGWAFLQVCGGFILAIALFRRLGASAAAQRLGLGVLCLLPACIAQEAADFRIWEGALALDLAVANLWWMATLDGRRTISTGALLIAAVASAVTFFINPPAGLAICAAWGIFALTRLPIRQTVCWALYTGIAIAMAATPWVLRNQHLMGAPVLRSNFGLELAIANHAGALDAGDPRAALTARMEAVHQTAPRLRAAGGEIAYSRAVGADAVAWILANPIDFARLTLRHYRQFYVPDTWEEQATNWNGAERFRIVALQIVGTLGIVGLIVGLARRHPAYPLLATYIIVAGLPYAVVQPIPRYGYLVYPLLVLIAARLVTDLALAIVPKRATGGRLLTA